MDYETAKKLLKNGHRLYKDCREKGNPWFMDSVAFGTKINDGVAKDLEKDGLHVYCIIGGFVEAGF